MAIEIEMSTALTLDQLGKVSTIERVQTNWQGLLYKKTDAPEELFGYLIPKVQESYVKKHLPDLMKRTEIDSLFILDLASGTGDYADALAKMGAKTLRYDISSVGLRLQKKRDTNHLLFQGVAWRLPFANDVFDGIHFKDALTHIHPEFRHRLFNEIHRTLRPGGILLLTTAICEYTPVYQYPTVTNNIRETAANEGFNFVKLSTWFPDFIKNDWYHLGNFKRERKVFVFKKR